MTNNDLTHETFMQPVSENTLIKNFRMFDISRIPWVTLISIICVAIFLSNYVWSESYFKVEMIKVFRSNMGMSTEAIVGGIGGKP